VQDPLLAVMTMAIPAFPHHEGSRNLWVPVLNAAARELARREDLALIDLELMTAKHAPSTALRDHAHPAPTVNMEVLNIMLNMVQQKAGHGKADPQL
jgi:hypothetical protein